jgi:transcriptional regulator with AAA-type ATPase domain
MPDERAPTQEELLQWIEDAIWNAFDHGVSIEDVRYIVATAIDAKEEEDEE